MPTQLGAAVCKLVSDSPLSLPLKELNPWKVGQSGSLSFRFATNERNGLLFYNGAGGSMAGGHGGNFGGSMGGGSRKDNGKVSGYSDIRMHWP